MNRAYWGQQIGHSLVFVTDRKLSLYGGYFTQDGISSKFHVVHPEWYAMFAGGASDAVPLLDSIRDALCAKKLQNTLGAVIRVARAAYIEERTRLIESEILPDFDIASYSEYMSLRQNEPDFFEQINDAIKKREEDWHLLFAGFDRRREPHIFLITERGKVTYCDQQRFGVIGSGAFAASLLLSRIDYRRAQPGELVAAVLAAKFFAETADFVGKTTVAPIGVAGTEWSSNDRQCRSARGL